MFVIESMRAIIDIGVPVKIIVMSSFWTTNLLLALPSNPLEGPQISLCFHSWLEGEHPILAILHIDLLKSVRDILYIVEVDNVSIHRLV